MKLQNLLLCIVIGSAALIAGCGNNTDQGTNNNEKATPSAAVGNAVTGKTIYENNCMACHGRDGENGHNGPNLKTSPVSKDVNQIISTVMNGRKSMPAFKDTLSEQQIRDLAAYINQTVANK